MSIFGNYMPGESSGMPTQGLLGGGKMDLGLLGLSLLANNNSKNFGQNLGRAGVNAIGMQQRMQQQQAMNQWRMQQQEFMRKRIENQDAETARQVAQRQKQQQALDDLVKNNKNIDPLLLKVNPSLALKQAYPSVDQRLPQASNAGFFKVGPNNKVEILTGPDGKPLMPPAFDPTLSYSNAYQKGLGKANTTITDKQDGVLQTEGQLLNKVSPTIGAQPQVNNTGYPYQVSPQVQAERDQVRLSLLNEELAQATDPNHRTALAKEIQQSGGNVGISVPTKAEQAAATELAKADAKYNTPEAIEKREKAKAFKQTTAQNVINAIDSVAKRVDGWSAGTGGNIMRSLPMNSDAKDIVADLETVKANFGFDRLQAMRDMSPTGGALGQVAVQELTALQASVANLNAETQSPDQLKRNLEKARQHYQNWLQTLGGTEQIMSPDEKMPVKRSREDILKQYGAI